MHSLFFFIFLPFAYVRTQTFQIISLAFILLTCLPAFDLLPQLVFWCEIQVFGGMQALALCLNKYK